MYEFVRGNPGRYTDPYGLNTGALNLGLGMGGGLQNLGSRLPKEELNVEIKEGAQQEASGGNQESKQQETSNENTSGNNREAQPQESGIIATPIPEQEPGIIATPIPEQEPGIIATPIPEQEPGIITTPIPEQEPGIIATPIPEQKPGDNIHTKEDGDSVTQSTENEAGNNSGNDGTQNTFPENPDELLPELPRDNKGRIYPNENTRIRPEKHDLKEGEEYAPRHHGTHYHVEVRKDKDKSFNNRKNVTKLKPENYKKGEGTGFLPGEKLPG